MTHFSSSSCPETLPVIYVHHGAQGDMVYSDQPVLIVHIDDGCSHDRIFVRIADAPPADLIRGPVAHTAKGSAAEVGRKARLAAWLEQVGCGLAALLGGRSVQ